jgi:tetratricopeptide (TPR) repeat protein
MRLSAYREAVACFEQALEALPHLPETRETLEAAIDLRFDLRNALLPLAARDKISTYLQEAEGLASALDDQRRLGWVSVYMSTDSRTAGYFREATRLAAAAHDRAEALKDVSLGLGADLFLGAACLSLGDYRRAADLLRHIVRSLDDDLSCQLLGQTGFPAVLARAYLAQSLAELGEFEEGLVFGEAGIMIAEAVDHSLSLAYACLRLGNLHAVKGELDRAVLLLERARGLTRDRRITFTAAIVTADLGHVHALSGRFAEGLSLVREAMAAYESMKVEVVKTRLLVHLGEAYLLADRIDDAHTCAERSLGHARARGERGYEAYALRLLGEIASHRKPADVEAAEAHYGESMTLAAELGMRPLIAHCHRGLGTLCGLAGKTPAAREHLTAAAKMFRQMNMGSWLGQGEAELAALR